MRVPLLWRNMLASILHEVSLACIMLDHCFETLCRWLKSLSELHEVNFEDSKFGPRGRNAASREVQVCRLQVTMKSCSAFAQLTD
jgi:hypothetical protein